MIKKQIISKKENLSKISEVSFFDDVSFDAVYIHNTDVSNSTATDVTIESSVLDHIVVNECIFKGLKLVDVSIEASSMVNSTWEEARLTRVNFSKSRLTGLKCPSAGLRDVIFQDCKGDYTAFRFAQLKNVQFHKCILNEVDFQGAELDNVSFIDCEMVNSEFSHAKLNNLDISSSRIEGIKITPEQLKGVTIDYSQTVIIAQLLGVKIK